MRTTLIRDLLTPLILLAFATYLTVNLFLIEVTDSTDFPGPRFFPAIIAGLIEKRFPGEEKSRRQLTISTDLVYDVLRKHQPDHVLLRAARADAATGLLDIRRLGEMLSRIQGRIVHKPLDGFRRSRFR